MKNNKRVERAFEFFGNNIGKTVSLAQLSEASTWKLSTCKTYQNKNYWQPYIQHDKAKREVTILKDFKTINLETFIKSNSQIR